MTTVYIEQMLLYNDYPILFYTSPMPEGFTSYYFFIYNFLNQSKHKKRFIDVCSRTNIVGIFLLFLQSQTNFVSLFLNSFLSVLFNSIVLSDALSNLRFQSKFLYLNPVPRQSTTVSYIFWKKFRLISLPEEMVTG